jgi:predicted enzyme related to lactoylglutathione lyase
VKLLVNIDVDARDVARAEAFYTQAFGWRRGRTIGGAVELEADGVAVYLLPKPAGSVTAGQARRYDRHWTPVHLDIVVDDIAAARDRSLAAGAVLESDIAEAAWGKLAMFADPFGHGFCLVEFSVRGYDAIATPVAK